MIDLKDLQLDDLKRKVEDFLLDEEKKMYAIIGATVVFTIIYVMFAILPTFSAFTENYKNSRELRKNIELVDSRIKRIDQMNAKLLASRKELEGYSKGLPDEREVPEFLEELSGMAKKAQVKMLSIIPYELKSAQSGASAQYYKEMPILIAAQSGYHQLGRFLSELEHGKRFITVEGISIRYDKGSPRLHSVMIGLKTYVSTSDAKK